MSRVLKIVNALLEQDESENEEFDPREYMLSRSREAIVARAPVDAHDLLSHAPDSFLNAFADGETAEWDDMEPPDESWPVYDSDDDTWRSICYYPALYTEGGKIYAQMNEVDSDGDHEINDVAVWGTPEHEALRKEFSYEVRSEHLMDYYAWVAEHGEDPCDYLFVPKGPAVTTKYLIGLKPVNGRAKFWKMRAISNEPPSPPATEDFTSLPQSVKDYLNLDAQGFCQDFQTWEELLAVDEVQQKNGYVQVEFENTENKEYDRAAVIKKIAAKAAKNEKKQLAQYRRRGLMSSTCF